MYRNGRALVHGNFHHKCQVKVLVKGLGRKLIYSFGTNQEEENFMYRI